MRLVIEVDENTEAMYELLDSVKESLKKAGTATLSPVHIKSLRITE